MSGPVKLKLPWVTLGLMALAAAGGLPMHLFFAPGEPRPAVEPPAQPAEPLRCTGNRGNAASRGNEPRVR